MPMARAISLSLGSASRSKGDSLRLPAAAMNGEMMLQSRVAEGHDLVALEMFVSAVTQVVAAFLRRRGGAIAVNDREIQPPVLVKLAHRAGKNPLDAAIGLPAP